MTHLLKIEWLKLKKYTAFKVLGIFFIVGVFATNYVVYSTTNMYVTGTSNRTMIPFSPYDFESVWQTTSYVTGYILLLPALLLIMIFTNEYAFKTHRQNIIDGLSRRQFISVKIMLAFIFTLIATLLVFINAIIFGFISGGSFSMEGIHFVGYFLLKALSYNLIAILISVLIKRTGFATGVFFIYLGAENIISQLLDLWSLRIRTDSGTDLGSLGDYLPMNAADGLLTFPKKTFSDVVKNALPTNYTWIVLSLSIAYLILFFIWSKRKFITADL